MGYFEDKKKELEEIIKLIEEGKKSLDFKIANDKYDVEKEKRKNSENLQREKTIFEEQSTQITEKINKKECQLKKFEEGILQMARERQIGFPWLADAYSEMYKLYDDEYAKYIAQKKNPAIRASELIRQEANRRRAAEKNNKIAQYIITYYENIAPFLLDLKEEVSDITDEDRNIMAGWSDEEKQDEVIKYISKEEYRKLPSVQRNQMALDRFWKRPKSKWLIGRLYERYVGYLFEKEGYDVEYVGIFKGFEDLGRDLICQKNNQIIVIQCKNWSKFRTIYEKHIFQFFGTVFQYKDENPDKKVKAIFYCTTKLSDLAKRFANELSIELNENHKFDQGYPCIKCNISGIDGTKIYHLPFDQQYDTVKIEPHKGEFYCKTVKEAEDAGFRRAFRYKGYKKS